MRRVGAGARLKAALYARVSSKAQAERHTIQSQLRALRHLAASSGWEVTGEYTDDGRTGRAGHLDARAGFARLVADAELRRFDLLLVMDVDRLTRSEDMSERAAILAPFQRLGIDIVTPGAGRLDLRTMLGELYAQLHAIVAAEETRKRIARSMAGKARAVAEGRKPQGPTPFGLAFDRAVGWSIDPVTGPLVASLFERVAGGESCRALDLELQARGTLGPRGGRWPRGCAYKLVCSSTYRGTWTTSRRHGLHVEVPRIVSDETWYAAQAALRELGKGHLKRTETIYLLSGIAVCDLCRSRIGLCPHGGRSPTTYACNQRRRPDPGRAPCRLPHHRVADLDPQIWDLVVRFVTDRDTLAEALARRAARDQAEAASWERDLAAGRARLERLTGAERVFLDRFRRGLVSEAALDAELAVLARDRALAEQQVAAAERAGRRTRPAAPSAREVTEALWLVRAEMSAPAERQRFVRAVLGSAPVLVGERVVRIVPTIPPIGQGIPACWSTGYGTDAIDLGSYVTVRLAG